MTGEDRKAKMLERVRALLAKANGTNFPEEADAFRAKADELMTAYAIEQWQVDAAQEGVQGRPQPERRDVDFGWYSGTPFRDQLWWIYQDLSEHCRCKAVADKIFGYRENRRIPVLGLPADLDYLDMLFTSIMFDFARKVDPKPDPERLSYEENLAMLKEAGLGWPEITRLMVNAGMLEYKVTTEDDRYHGGMMGEGGKVIYPQKDIRKPWLVRKNYAKPAHDYRNWCKKTGRPQSYTDHRTYRRNFADGYYQALSMRLREMRRKQRNAYDAEHEAGGMELVMRDIKHVINDLLWAEFPDLAPHPDDCECEVCHANKCDDPKCDRPACKRRRKPVKYRPDNRRTDWAAREAGMAAGREVDIAGHQGRRVAGRKGLPE